MCDLLTAIFSVILCSIPRFDYCSDQSSLNRKSRSSDHTHRMATEQNVRSVPMSNLEPNHFINYASMQSTLSAVKAKLTRPLTYAEKLLYSHIDNAQDIDTIIRGETYLKIRPDRVASPDSTGQTVLLQFMSAEIPEVAVPYTVHCDHLIQAEVAGTGIEDLGEAWKANEEVYGFLSSACAKYGIGFWKPGSGIIHQILLENYAFPGGLMLGTDSHTPNAGGLGMCAIGVGGADAVDVLAGSSWEIRAPKIMGVNLIGEMNGWTAPKGDTHSLERILHILTIHRHHSNASWNCDNQGRHRLHHRILWTWS